MDLLFPLLSALLGVFAFTLPKLVFHTNKIVAVWSVVVFLSTITGSLQGENSEISIVLLMGIFSTTLNDSIYLSMANIARLKHIRKRITTRTVIRFLSYFGLAVISLKILLII